MTGPSVVFQVDVEVPGGWWELPVGSDHLERDVARAVDARLAGSPEWWPQRDAIVDLAQATASRAAAVGAVFACQIGIVEGSEAFSASVVIALDALPGVDDAAQLEDLVRRSGADSGTEDDVVLEPCTVGRIGPGLRRRAVRHPDDGPPSASVRYYAVVPGSDQTAIVHCASGQAGDMDGLLVLFGALVATVGVSMVEPDDLGGRGGAP